MKSNFLLPRNFKIIGLILFIPFLILGIMNRYYDLRFSFLKVNTQETAFLHDKNTNFTDEIVLTGLIVSLLMIAFARLKDEDEYIHFLRLESWQWAVIVNFILLLAAIWIFYGESFFDVMVYNMLTIPLLFIIRLHYLLFRSKKAENKKFAL
jgi:disulfide bond formation protein DsbB